MQDQNVKDIYNVLGIDVAKLGCIMMGTDPLKVSDLVEEEDLYFTTNQNLFWVNGIVSEWDTPHVTLLYGLMQSGKDWKAHVDKLLDGWSMPSVTVDHVDFFNSTWEAEPYYCIVAKLQVTDELKEGNARLRKLPHIDTFADYTPHITLCYIKQDEELRDRLIGDLNSRFALKNIPTTELDYGK